MRTRRHDVRLRWQDWLQEVAASLRAQPQRAVFVACVCALGVATYIASVGLLETANAQVTQRFLDMYSNTLSVRMQQTAVPEQAEVLSNARTIKQLSGVRDVLPLNVFKQSANVATHPGARTSAVAAYGVFSDPTAALGAQKISGADLAMLGDMPDAPVVALGRRAAERIGLDGDDIGVTVYVNGHALTVITVIGDVAARPELLDAVLVPNGKAKQLSVTAEANRPSQLGGGEGDGSKASADKERPSVADGRHDGESIDVDAARPRLPAHGGAIAHDETGLETEYIVTTAPNATREVGRVLPLALSPHKPQSVMVATPPTPEALRKQVSGDIGLLQVAAAVVALAIGVAGVAVSAVQGSAQRIHELGLRRAMGARRWHVMSLFVGEFALAALVGGPAGWLVGVLVVRGVAAMRDWSAVLGHAHGPAAAGVMWCAAVVAAVIPTWLAVMREPMRSLRS